MANELSQADSAAQHRHNESIVLAAAHLQLQYERDGDLSAAIQRAGFSEPEVELSDAMRDDSGTQVPGHACLRDPVRAIIDAVDPIRLAPGWGVLVNVTRFFASTGEDPGTRHLVSFHRAHSGELQFFEVRVGVYTVNVLAGFVLAWRDAYLTLGRQVELVPSQGRPFVYIRV
jgi:hypothetical protein